MGICGSSEAKDTPEAVKSKELDKVIREDEKKANKEVKLLLLGAGESGKSTVLKSMRIIHDIPFTPQEKENFRRLVFQNVVQGMKVLLEAMEEWGQTFENPEHAQYLGLFVTSPEISEGEPFPSSYYEPLKLLWQDAGVQAAQRRAHEIALPENMIYYYNDLDRLFGPQYQPSEADILRCRNKTTGIIETAFPLQDRTYRIFDVGGQRSERKKWIHCFENVTAVLFIVALSGYDACLVEDKESNQMQEALMLFENICNSKWFVRTSMILFLNKVDIFKSMIESTGSPQLDGAPDSKRASEPITKFFPDYRGSPNDFEAAKMFFRDKFIALNRSQTKEVYPSFTNATDTGLLRMVMTSVTDTILTNSLRDHLL
ncbi:unnamed protein product [Sympodiomycopsis kandeliae]